MTQIKYKLIKVLMVCCGLETMAAGWKAQTNPLSYGCTPNYCCMRPKAKDLGLT